jgi:hypothetical protein
MTTGLGELNSPDSRLFLERNHPFLVLKEDSENSFLALKIVSGNSGINHQRRLIKNNFQKMFLLKVITKSMTQFTNI